MRGPGGVVTCSWRTVQEDHLVPGYHVRVHSCVGEGKGRLGVVQQVALDILGEGEITHWRTDAGPSA